MCGFREDNRGHHHCYGLFPASTTPLLLSLPLSLTATYEFPVETPFNILAELPLGSREGGLCHCGIINAFKCLPASLCACLFMYRLCVCVCAVSAFCCRKLNKAAVLPASKVALKRKHQQHRLLAAAWVNKKNYARVS